jgi:hypothetical protein
LKNSASGQQIMEYQGVASQNYYKHAKVPLLPNMPLALVGKGHQHRFSNRHYEIETKSLNLHHRVKHPVPKALFSTGWNLHLVPKQFLSKKNQTWGEERVWWPRFKIWISCLACAFLTISPTHHLWWEERYFPFEVTHGWAFGTGW